MAKHRSRGRGIQAGNGKSIRVDVPLPLLSVVLDTREAFHELCIRTGREVLLAMMQSSRAPTATSPGSPRMVDVIGATIAVRSRSPPDSSATVARAGRSARREHLHRRADST